MSVQILWKLDFFVLPSSRNSCFFFIGVKSELCKCAEVYTQQLQHNTLDSISKTVRKIFIAINKTGKLKTEKEIGLYTWNTHKTLENRDLFISNNWDRAKEKRELHLVFLVNVFVVAVAQIVFFGLSSCILRWVSFREKSKQSSTWKKYLFFVFFRSNCGKMKNKNCSGWFDKSRTVQIAGFRTLHYICSFASFILSFTTNYGKEIKHFFRYMYFRRSLVSLQCSMAINWFVVFFCLLLFLPFRLHRSPLFWKITISVN